MIQDIATVFWRDWIVLRHRLLKFILSRMVAPVLYMVAFGWGLARSVNTGGGSYLDFIVPGILALNSMNIAFNSLTPLFIAVLALNCVIFAEAGFCAALIVRNFEDMARFNTYLLLPMSFLCGTFFKTDRLPHAAAFVIELLPLTHASSLLRAINSGAPFSITSAAILLVYAVLLFGACHYIYKGLKNQ